jgi:transposase
LALAAIYDGATRAEATKIGGVTLQIVRDWLVKFNTDAPRVRSIAGSGTTAAAER